MTFPSAEADDEVAEALWYYQKDQQQDATDSTETERVATAEDHTVEVAAAAESSAESLPWWWPPADPREKPQSEEPPTDPRRRPQEPPTEPRRWPREDAQQWHEEAWWEQTAWWVQDSRQENQGSRQENQGGKRPRRQRGGWNLEEQNKRCHSNSHSDAGQKNNERVQMWKAWRESQKR